MTDGIFMTVLGTAFLIAWDAVFVAWVLLRPHRLQDSSLAWIFLIILLPIAGGIAFLLFGQVWMPGDRARRHGEIVTRVRGHPSVVGRAPPVTLDSPEGRGVAALAERGGDMPVRGGNAMKLFAVTEEAIDAMVADIDASRESCHLLFYIYLPDSTGEQVAQALIGAAGRGVTCRLLWRPGRPAGFSRGRRCPREPTPWSSRRTRGTMVTRSRSSRLHRSESTSVSKAAT